MTREEREEAISYIKLYRRLDENLHNTAPKNSVSYYATDKCLKYWDAAIHALSQEPIDKSAMMYEIYMEGVNMSGEYQGCWVRFKDIEKIVDKYMGDKE